MNSNTTKKNDQERFVPEETNLLREKVREIESRFGLVPGGNDLVKLLGFRSSAALRAAVQRGGGIVKGVPVFRVPGQVRGMCSSAESLAKLSIAVESLCSEALERERQASQVQDNSQSMKAQLEEVVKKMSIKKAGHKMDRLKLK